MVDVAPRFEIRPGTNRLTGIVNLTGMIGR